MNWNKEDFIIFIKQNIKTILLAVISSILIVFFIVFFMNKPNREVKDDFQNYTVSEQTTISSTVNNRIFIDIKGQVVNPGFYEMYKEDRVKDAIEKAGGLLEDADTSNVNLSQKLKDQMMIVIPSKNKKNQGTSQEDGGQKSSQTTNKAVNINLATKEELMTISGIGETRAQAIIDYRENVGDFEKIEDITKVKGIGKSSFEKIKDKIEV